MRVQESPWSDDRVMQLRSCFAAGLTCSQIAREIGVTRNAVIGKLHRIDLQRGHKPAKIKAKRIYKQRIRALKVRQTPYPPLPEEIEIFIPTRGVTLLDLTEFTCRWPINEPGTKEFRFCGNETWPSRPYCAGHCRLAYRGRSHEPR